MKQINGTVTLSFLEEDNQQRVIFRVIPLCTRDGVVFRDKLTEFPDHGSLRIVPDKREQSTFKERMRSMGNLCAIQLCSEGKELAKVRQNRNYDPGQGELNQFAIYSDVICEFAEDGVFEVFADDADHANALSTHVLIRRGQVLYGPVARGEAVELAQLRPFGNDQYLLQTAIMDDSERTFYWNPEMTISWRQRRGTLRRNKARVETGEEAVGDKQTEEIVADDTARKVNEPTVAVQAPIAEPTVTESQPDQKTSADIQSPSIETVQRVSRLERNHELSQEGALPIGTRLSILDDNISFAEQIELLDQPLSNDANLLGSATPTVPISTAHSSMRVSGTPLVRAGVKAPQPIRHGEPLHYVVEKQVRTAHREQAWHEETYRPIENPIENLNLSLAKAWETPETRQQAIESLSNNEAFMNAFIRHLHLQGRELRVVKAAQEQLQDIEAERLSLLMQLEATKNDCKHALDTMLAELTHKKREELATLENQLHAAREERDALMGAVTVLGDQVQIQTLTWVSERGMQVSATTGDTIAISPVIGVRRSLCDMVANIKQAMHAQGFACNDDDATELLLHFALNDEFCICGDQLSEAEMCANTLLEGLGLANVSARTNERSLLHVASLLPANGLRTPTVEVCPPGRPTLSAYGHKTIRVMEAKSHACMDASLPVVFAPRFQAGLREQRPMEAVKPASLESFTTLLEEVKPLWEQGEQWFAELDQQLSEQRSALYGLATQRMRVFVSAAAERLRGGFIAAADAAVLGWVIPAVCRQELNPEPLRQAIAGLPRCLSALGIQ